MFVQEKNMGPAFQHLILSTSKTTVGARLSTLKKKVSFFFQNLLQTIPQTKVKELPKHGNDSQSNSIRTKHTHDSREEIVR